MTTKKLSVLVYDIETAPGEVYAFSPKIRFAPYSQWKRYPFMLQWSAAWLSGGKVIAETVTPEEVRNRDDSRIVDSIATLMRSADIVLAHNGDNFDIPWVRGRTWIHDLEPLGPIASIDTRKLSAFNFAQPHNNLDALIDQKLGRRKIKTDFSWWTDIIESAESGDDEACRKALSRMLRYCRKDTHDLRDLFQTMIPHVSRLPRLVDTNEAMICPFCGHDDLQKRGKKRTAAYTYQRYQCNNCKRYPSVRTNDKTNRTDLRST
jgi:hypothetical protein